MGLVFFALGLGWLLRRIEALPTQAPAVLDRFVVWVALPALVLRELPRLSLAGAAWIPVVVAWTGLGLAALLVLAAARAGGWDHRTRATLLVVVPLGNTSFLGLAAVSALLGASHLGPALVYDQLGSFLGLATWGTVVAALASGEGRPPLIQTLGRVFRFPPLVALLVALLRGVVEARWGPIPGAGQLDSLLEPFAASLVPLALVAVGMRLAWPGAGKRWGAVCLGLLVRLLVVPGVAFAVLVAWSGAGVGGLEIPARAALLQAAMPPMVTAGVVASEAGLDEELAAALVGVGVLVSLVTLPLWAAVLGG